MRILVEVSIVEFEIICNSEKVKDRLENSSSEITGNDFGLDNDFLMTRSHFHLSNPPVTRSEKPVQFVRGIRTVWTSLSNRVRKNSDSGRTETTAIAY